MARRRTRRSRSLAAQAIELGIAAPQVIALRAVRMHDREELYRMGAEKMAAFNEAWSAMAVQAVRANQELALSFMQSLWFPWIRPKSSVRSAAHDILGKGLAPIRRRAVANARRLGRTKRK